ncbi:MAG: DUF2970 domain-containing protein [Proteobacteria bacterium]|nr:DUF2970 domain-containing protein [Pseudomonadota bacterium]
MRVLAAVINVQSSKNQAHDFEHGPPRRFIIVGIVATLTFVALTYFAVQAVLKAAGL